MAFYRLSYLFFFLLLITGCLSSEIKPDSIGKESEVLLICPDDLFETPAVKCILSELSSEYPVLPQHENLLDVLKIKEAEFSNLLKRHRAILKIENTEGENNMAVKRDVYAHHQVIVTLKINLGQSVDSVIFCNIGKVAADFFVKENLSNRVAKLKKSYNKKLAEIIIRNFGFRMFLPEDFFVAVEQKNFIWLRRETANTSSGILIYAVSPVTADNIVSIRDSITRLHIPGPSEGSYMKVNHDIDPVIYNDSLLNSPAIVARGIWKVEKDFMGGPFVNICIEAPDKKKSICMDAFVYAPRFDKRDYINRLMAILYSAEKVN